MTGSPERLPSELDPLDLMTAAAIYGRADQVLLDKLREDRRVERKPAGTHAPVVGDYVCMWANTQGGGLIVLGVEDDGSVSGCATLAPSRLKALEQAGRTYAPDARYETRRVSAVRRDGVADYLLLVHVSYREDKVVRTVRGEAYIRYGDQKRRLTPEEVRELEADRGQVETEQERCGLTYPEEFDLAAVEQFSDRVRRGMDLDGRLRPDEILELRRLGRRDSGKFSPNVACALLFARDPGRLFPGCKVRFLRFAPPI